MKYRASRSPIFETGNHIKAARMMAGLSQAKLAQLAGLALSSVKRIEQMGPVSGSEHATGRIADALARQGITAGRNPFPFVQVDPSRLLAA